MLSATIAAATLPASALAAPDGPAPTAFGALGASRAAVSAWADALAAEPTSDAAAPARESRRRGDVHRHGPFAADERAVTRHASITNTFTDVCEDPTGDGPDLRRTRITADDQDAFVFEVEFCAATATSMPGALTQWLLGPADDLVTRRVELAGDADPASWLVDVFDTKGTVSLADDTLLFSTDADPVDTHTASFVLDGSPHPLGGLSEDGFAFFVAAVSAGSDDFLPEDHEPLVVFPEACDVAFSDRQVVRAHDFDRAVAAATAAGLRIGASLPEDATFEVRDTIVDPATLAALPGVAEVRPSAVVATAANPDDSEFRNQWFHDTIGSLDAWEIDTGSIGVRIAIVDDGIDGTRHDLAGRVAAGRDITTNRILLPGVNSDRGGHGTLVAGVLGATGDNRDDAVEGGDIAGLDWHATLAPYRIFDAAGCASEAEVAAGLRAAVDDGASIVNLSLGTRDDTPLLRSAVAHAEANDVLVVASSGNDGDPDDFGRGWPEGGEPNYPAAYTTVVSVGASTSGFPSGGEQVVDYSNTASDVFLVAPGGDGRFAPPSATEILTLGERDWFSYVSGTSFSSPMVAGAAGLLRASNPCLDVASIRDLLAETAVPILDDSPLLADGRRVASGHGRLDVGALLQTGAAAARDLDVAADLARVFRLPGTSCASSDAVVVVTDAPDHGTFELRGHEAIYEPAPGFVGTDEVTYRIGGSNPTEVTVTLRVTDIVRLADADRYATAAAISAFTFPPDVSVVYVASGVDFPDALAATSAAGSVSAPVLLTAPGVLPTATRVELTRLSPDQIVLVGGENAVSSAVEASLRGLAGPGGVVRRAGVDRFDTAATITSAAFPGTVDAVYAATGLSFPDALAGSSPAVRDGAPLALVTRDAVPSATRDELLRLDPDTVYLLGGTSAVGQATADTIAAVTGASIVRLSDRSRYLTAVDVSRSRFADSAAVSTVFIATGASFPDALAGGTAAGLAGAPLLLVPPGGSVPQEVLDEIARLSPSSLVVLGGQAAVPDAQVAQLR